LSTRRHRVAHLFVVAAVAATGVVLGPVETGAGPLGPGRDRPATQRGDVGPGSGSIEVAVDALKAEDADVVGALDDLGGDVRRQLAEVEQAREALDDARSALTKADERVAKTQERIGELVVASDEVVIEAFVNPPSDAAIDALAAESLGDSTLKRSILDRQATEYADVLDELDAAEAELDERRKNQEEAASTAERRIGETEAGLVDLEAAVSAQAAFVGAVEARLDRQLAEAEALASVDPAMAKRLKAREADLAEKLREIRGAEEQRKAREALKASQHKARREAEKRAAAQAAAAAAQAPRALGPATGGLATVACPGGGAITVDSSLAGNLRSLLDAAASSGLRLCGGGYRDPQKQIALRSQNCGSGGYAIYQMPSSSCSPPTARPGTSNHEKGLAVDFQCNGSGINSRSGPCFSWLAANAARYGFHNLPSEPWHWSTDGT
jgi:LAS superfamily LD-carboxypeptidase LdcB